MKSSLLLAVSLVAVATGGGLVPAHADSADAMCQVRKDGETKQGPSGPCVFSQRQGHIDLDLRNGTNYSLSPTDQPNHYKDQKGNKVVRTLSGGDTQEFKWEGGRKIVVTYSSGGPASGGAAASGYAAGVHDEADRFDSICGVIVDGQHYRYRCEVADHYSGGRKVRTTLRYPDQTIELTWKSGSRVGLQFEGMVPKETSYATAEGETNFRFEGKTYFYISNKDMARSEVQHFRG